MDDMARMARVFELGTITSISPVAGGLSNEMWHVVTDRGGFAVKWMVVNAGNPDFHANVEAAFLVEQAAFARGVPCPEPIPLPGGGCLARVQGRWVRVHRWVHGTPPAAEHRDDAAALLARIHADAPTTLSPLDDEPWDVEGWSGLADSPGLSIDIAASLRASAPLLADLEARTSDPDRRDVHVLSHGDLDPKNTLLVDGTLMAVDWDAAGARSRTRETVAMALDWTSTPGSFRAAIDAYVRAGGVRVPAEPWVFGGWVDATCGWLVHHARHSADNDRGRDEIRTAMRRLTGLHTRLTEYLEALM